MNSYWLTETVLATASAVGSFKSARIKIIGILYATLSPRIYLVLFNMPNNSLNFARRVTDGAGRPLLYMTSKEITFDEGLWLYIVSKEIFSNISVKTFKNMFHFL